MSLYHLEPLEDYAGIPEGSINTAYWVRVAGKRYFLRITEKKKIQDMIYERALLEHLARAKLPVPRLLENVAKGTFTPWSVRGRFVSLFDYMDGRELGVFEIRPSHISCVGEFAAKMHLATQNFKKARANEFDLIAVDNKLSRLEAALNANRLGQRYAADIGLLAEELSRQKSRDVTQVPLGTVHGDLFVDNIKFRDGKLSGVIDFEMSSTERLTWDLAVGINAWCWEPSSTQKGGPSGRFDAEKTCAFLHGYSEVRPLSGAERAVLPDDLRLAAARFAITRLIDFELKKLPAERRLYKDYRHYIERLRALRDGGAESLIAYAFDRASSSIPGAEG